MPTMRVNGTSLYYEEQGAGPGVILLHGSWSDHGTWAAVVGRFLVSRVWK
jgi:pimeloyl-ACP methyl ester carboxylesterase